ncbi:MAG: hypothetical protein ABI662_02260 [Dermatophilaceae bacterium]
MGTVAKPVYQRWWFRAPAVLVVLVIFGAANNFGEPSDAAPSTGHQSAAARLPGLRADKGWTLDGTRFGDQAVGDGDFGATARVTNTTKTAASGIFTVTVLVNDRTVASLQGSADNVAAGGTVTVQLASHDDYQPGPYTLVFQTNASYH